MWCLVCCRPEQFYLSEPEMEHLLVVQQQEMEQLRRTIEAREQATGTPPVHHTCSVSLSLSPSL